MECYYSIRQTLQYHTYTTSDKEIVCQDGMKTYILPRDVLFFKVKKGVFRIPDNVPSECQNLIKEMIKVDPVRRISVC